MTENKKTGKTEMDFEEMLEQRMKANFGGASKEKAEASNDRLKEMNKKLPAWSLEPPYNFIR